MQNVEAVLSMIVFSKQFPFFLVLYFQIILSSLFHSLTTTFRFYAFGSFSQETNSQFLAFRWETSNWIWLHLKKQAQDSFSFHDLQLAQISILYTFFILFFILFHLFIHLLRSAVGNEKKTKTETNIFQEEIVKMSEYLP